MNKVTTVLKATIAVFTILLLAAQLVLEVMNTTTKIKSLKES